MRDYLANEVRNVTVLGHSGAGKSSVIEACLYHTKQIDKFGRNNDGTTALNFDPEEGKRGLSVYCHLAPVEWKNMKINFIDTPGYMDYEGEEATGLAVGDNALIVVNGKEGIEIGDAFELAIERGKLIDPDSEPIKGAEYVDDLMMYLQRKIYIINCGHAIAGYYGQALKGYEIVQDALRDPDLLPQIRAAMLESASALEKKYGFTHESLVDYMETMMVKRFTTPGVVDPIARVSREPIRKISPNDRIMGPANNCEEYGLDNSYLLKGVACALKFKAEDDPQADELQKFIADNGVEAAIVKYTGVAEGSRMYNVILDEYKKLG
jgi:hypothetical protein